MKIVTEKKIERVGPWVIVTCSYECFGMHVPTVATFLAAQVQTIKGDQSDSIVFFLNGEELHVNVPPEPLWKAVAGPATDNAVSLNASLGEVQEQP